MSGHPVSWIEGVLAAAPGELLAFDAGNRDGRVFRGGCVDSRRDCAGRLFFAIPGERVDGHDFVISAFDAGCSAAVVERADVDESLRARGLPVARVGSARRALGILAAAHRTAVGARVIAITGSSGKTSTKEYVRAVIRTRYRVHASAGNLNSTVGAPLAVLDADEDAEYLVCEVGANQPGEVGQIAEIVKPDVAVITNIGDAHVGHFGSRENIARAKSELLRGLGPLDNAVLPSDDDFFAVLAGATRARVITFGAEETADTRVQDVRQEANGTSFSIGGVAGRIPVLGDYHAVNAAAAVAVGEVCGIERGVAINALGSITPLEGRGRIHTVNGFVVIDESYNASPSSVVRSIEMLRRADGRRRIAVLGDMKELGERVDEGMQRVGDALAASGLDVVLWCGEQATSVGERLGGDASPRFEVVAGAADAARVVRSIVSSGDVVLVKASRACGLDETVHVLTRLNRELGE